MYEKELAKPRKNRSRASLHRSSIWCNSGKDEKYYTGTHRRGRIEETDTLESPIPRQNQTRYPGKRSFDVWGVHAADKGGRPFRLLLYLTHRQKDQKRHDTLNEKNAWWCILPLTV